MQSVCVIDFLAFQMDTDQSSSVEEEEEEEDERKDLQMHDASASDSAGMESFEPKDVDSTIEAAVRSFITANPAAAAETLHSDGEHNDNPFMAPIREAVTKLLKSMPGTISKHATASTPALEVVAHSSKGGDFSLGSVGSLGTTTDFDQVEIFINGGEMKRIEWICRSNELVRAAMQIICQNVVGGGMSVSMEVNGVSIKLNQIMQRMFDVEWVQRFVKDLLWHLCMYGFVVVRLIRSNLMRTEAVPSIVDPMHYELTVIDSMNKGREYRIYPIRFSDDGSSQRPSDGVYSGEDGVKRRRAKKIYEGDESLAVYVLPGSEPLSNGALNSPLSTIADKLQKLDWMWEDLSRASHWAARPTYGINTAQNKVAAQDADSLKHYNPPLPVVALHLEGEQIRHKKAEKHEIGEAIQAASDAVEFNAAEDAANGRTGRYGQNPHATSAPMKNFFIPGLGHQLANGPAPAFNPHVNEATKIVASLLAITLGVPSEMIIPGQQVHAANAEFAMRRWDTVVSDYQKVIEPIVADLFAMAYSGMIEDFRQRWPKETVEKWASHADTTADAVRRHIKSSGAPANVPIDADKHLTEGFKHQLKSKQEKAQSKICLREITHKNAAKLMAEKSPVIHVRFDQTPMRMFEDIWNLFERDMIVYEEVVKHVQSIYHIDPSMIPTKEQRDKQMEEKRKKQHDLDERYGPEEEEQNGAAKKPKKTQATAQQGSSSKAKKKSGAGEGKGKTGAVNASK